MTKVVVRTDSVSGFFARAQDAARRADQGKSFDGRVTLSFEDPQRMFAVLSRGVLENSSRLKQYRTASFENDLLC